MELPIRPPVKPMLAKPVADIPPGQVNGGMSPEGWFAQQLSRG